jgi:hypothetical protein
MKYVLEVGTVFFFRLGQIFYETPSVWKKGGEQNVETGQIKRTLVTVATSSGHSFQCVQSLV